MQAQDDEEESFSSISNNGGPNNGGDDEFDVFPLGSPPPKPSPPRIAPPAKVVVTPVPVVRRTSNVSVSSGSVSLPSRGAAARKRAGDSEDENNVSIDGDDSSSTSEDAADLLARAEFLLQPPEKAPPKPTITATVVSSMPATQRRLTPPVTTMSNLVTPNTTATSAIPGSLSSELLPKARPMPTSDSDTIVPSDLFPASPSLPHDLTNTAAVAPPPLSPPLPTSAPIPPASAPNAAGGPTPVPNLTKISASTPSVISPTPASIPQPTPVIQNTALTATVCHITPASAMPDHNSHMQRQVDDTSPAPTQPMPTGSSSDSESSSSRVSAEPLTSSSAKNLNVIEAVGTQGTSSSPSDSVAPVKEFRPFVFPKEEPARKVATAKRRPSPAPPAGRKTSVGTGSARPPTPSGHQSRGPSPSANRRLRPQSSPSPSRTATEAGKLGNSTTSVPVKQVLLKKSGVDERRAQQVSPRHTSPGRRLNSMESTGSAASNRGTSLNQPLQGRTSRGHASANGDDDVLLAGSIGRAASPPRASLLASTLLTPDGKGIKVEDMRESIERLTSLTLEMNRIRMESAQRREEIRKRAAEQAVKDAAFAVAEQERQDRARILMKLVQEHNQRIHQFHLDDSPLLDVNGDAPFAVPHIVASRDSSSSRTLASSGSDAIARSTLSKAGTKVAAQLLAVANAVDAGRQCSLMTASTGRTTPCSGRTTPNGIDGYATRHRTDSRTGRAAQPPVQRQSPARKPRPPRRQSLPPPPSEEPFVSWREVHKKERSSSNSSNGFRDCWSRLYQQGMADCKGRMAWAEELRRRREACTLAACPFTPDLSSRHTSSPLRSPQRAVDGGSLKST